MMTCDDTDISLVDVTGTLFLKRQAARPLTRERRSQRCRMFCRPAAGSASQSQPEVVMIGPEDLREELEAAGLVLLGVGQHRGNPDVLVVYLHGNAGQWVDGGAITKVAAVPGVKAVSESVQSPSILLVRVDYPTDPDRP
jgi:hypothetical protein